MFEWFQNYRLTFPANGHFACRELKTGGEADQLSVAAFEYLSCRHDSVNRLLELRSVGTPKQYSRLVVGMWISRNQPDSLLCSALMMPPADFAAVSTSGLAAAVAVAVFDREPLGEPLAVDVAVVAVVDEVA